MPEFFLASHCSYYDRGLLLHGLLFNLSNISNEYFRCILRAMLWVFCRHYRRHFEVSKLTEIIKLEYSLRVPLMS